MSSRIDATLLNQALFDRRWTALARVGVDLAGITTWDRALDRRTRLLVPVDVQAFVVPAAGAEPTVAIAGAGNEDPEPFAAGTVRPAGVHLHWALPDALLRGRQPPADPATGAVPEPEFPPLPDRWVVIRVLLPTGRTAALLRGWVIDARARTVTPLAEYAGTPAAGEDGDRLDRLDAAFGGSLLWTASYTASAGRFGFHDPLADLPAAGAAEAPSGLDGAGAAYIVAGWWSDLAQDPLAGAVGQRHLDEQLAELGWHVVHDGDDDVHESEDPRIARIRTGLGLTSPAESAPVQSPSVTGEEQKLENANVQIALPVKHAESVLVGPARPRYATMLHGAILGVPLGALPAGADARPASDALTVALGTDIDDVVAAFGAPALGAGAANRAAAERLTAAFTSDLLDRLGSPDGLAELAEREHADGFASLPGAPLAAARPDRLRGEDSAPLGPHNVGRKAGRVFTGAGGGTKLGAAKLRWRDGVDLVARGSGKLGSASAVSEVEAGPPSGEPRVVRRPAPRWYRPEPPMLAIRGARPNHRHHGDGLYDDSGRLRCRYPRECVPAWEGVVTGEVVVPSIGSRGVPDEVLPVVREAVLLNPYAHRWLAAAGAAATGTRTSALETRLAGEMVRLYGVDGRYDGTTRVAVAQTKAPAGSWARVSATTELEDRQLTAELARFSVLKGTPPSPVAITTWRQPWVPLWLEWEVTLEGRSGMRGWELRGLDLERTEASTGTEYSLTCQGRVPVGQGVTRALQLGMQRWLEAELQRDASGQSTLDAGPQDDLAELSDKIAPLDLVSASLNGVREQLLGLAYQGSTVEVEDADGRTRTVATALPLPLFGGQLRLDRLRLVDAFGRVLTVPADRALTTLTLEVPDLPNGMRLRPRLQHAARWLWRLVDPALPATADPATAREAFVDQLAPELAVNPVAGFLLPDHIDEALEFFNVSGEPLGQLMHDAVSGGVVWEPAPGRPLPPDAGPLAGLDPHARLTGEIAAGVVQADASARLEGRTAESGSALNALLRAIDTTLWTVDTFAAIGSPTVAGLVGRPIAVVRATLRLDVPDDLEEVSTPDPAARRAAFEALREQRFPLQLGTLERSDDALLGFYVDDDYGRLHLVDRVVAAQAREGGRHRGQLGLLGDIVEPPLDPLTHPFVLAEDVLWVRPGQTLRLTLLMLPAGRVHLTSGILPRKALALGDDWVAPGLRRVMPSVRVGPVLVDPSEIRLPLVKLLGERQTFTRRTGPLTWRDDPIVAATQAALLPRMPHEIQEGWIRVTPEEPEATP